jgi:hypothetical protein
MRPLFRILILSGFLLSALSAVTADAKSNGRITGNISSVSGNPLRNAIIRIYKDMQQGETFSVAKSDSRGFFKSIGLTPGIYYLQVSHQGYRPVTTTRFAIDRDSTLALDIILQEFIGYVSKEDDPRNWDLKTVMRSTSDRRLIFRNNPGIATSAGEESGAPFHRSGAMSVASSTSIGDKSYLVRPQASQNGVSSNFAFTEPVSPHGRMILSGQLDFGNGSFWRLRDTYNYRPDKDHDYRVSVGYGRMNVNYPGSSSIASQLLSQESGLRESGLQTLAFSMEGNTKFLDLLAIKYGFDYSRLHYGASKSFFYPSVQILLTPKEGWNIQTSFTSRRLSDTNSVVLPDDEILDLSEPTLIMMVDNKVSMSQIRHSEIAAQRTITPSTAIEVAVYKDRVIGPGFPIMLTTITPRQQKSRVIEMNGDRSSQRGMRVTVNHKILKNLSASVDYVYGDSLCISNIGEPISSDHIERNLASYLQQAYLHSLTGRLDATIPITKTNVLATMRWYSTNPLTPVDWFSDRMDIGTNSTNFEIRQAIPLPEFLEVAGRWEVLLDLRNILNQGREILSTTDGEIVLNRNPRSLRFGLSLNFR